LRRAHLRECPSLFGRYFSPLGASDTATHTCQRLYDAAAATALAEAAAKAQEVAEAAAAEEAEAAALALAKAAAENSQASTAPSATDTARGGGEEDTNPVPKPLRRWVHRLATLPLTTSPSLEPTRAQQQSLTPPRPAPQKQQQPARWQAADSRFFWNKRVSVPSSFLLTSIYPFFEQLCLTFARIDGLPLGVHILLRPLFFTPLHPLNIHF